MQRAVALTYHLQAMEYVGFRILKILQLFMESFILLVFKVNRISPNIVRILMFIELKILNLYGVVTFMW
ncbi:hypothetical protein BGV40_17330 [Methanosarcina sp. Ant1]|nr:hypothetical protein BGV40_17330 [Methanosarcina sp. Ant1]